MISNPASEARRFALVLVLSVVVGLILDAVAITLAITFFAYLAWYYRQLWRLHSWLNSPTPKDPPDSHGLWGTVFDDIHNIQQRQFKYRAKLKKTIKRFRDSTYALKDGFVMLDREGTIDWWNPSASLLIGLKDDHDRRQPIFNLLRDPDFKRYVFTQQYQQPFILSSPLNNALTLEVHFTLFGKRDLLMIVRDVTELRRLEKIRTDFVANVSHELKTPLTVVDGYLENINDNAEIIDPRWQGALQQMVYQTRRMKSLVQDLLALSRLESRENSQSHTEVDLSQVIQGVVSEVRDIYEKRKQRILLNTDTDHLLLGHTDELHSLISNLVINACKYSPDDSDISISWAVSDNQGILSVSDQGIGIAAKEIPRLTERFYRAEKGRSQAVSGTGLGLAIVKHILINHDALLEIDSKVGEGSSFTCRFPVQRITTKPTAAVS